MPGRFTTDFYDGSGLFLDPKTWGWVHKSRPMDLNEWKTWSEIAKNLTHVLGLGGGLFLLYKWIYSRKDRAADIHERSSGQNPEWLVHIHGEIFVNRCSECNQRDKKPVDPGSLPKCSECDGLMRPDVVWFDEELDDGEVARVHGFLAGGECDLVLVIGTSARFDYILDWALGALGSNGILIEVNPEKTRLSYAADLTIREGAASYLPKFTRRYGS